MEAAFFDLDKTVIARASAVAFGTPFYREGLISRRTILRGLWGQLVYLHLGANEAKIARMRSSVLALTKGWEQARVRSIVEEALEAVVEPIVYGEALELMSAHRAAGRLIVIVSASPEEIVQPLSRYLGADEAIASRALTDDDGRYTGVMAFDAFGPAKVAAIHALGAERGIDLTASFAYSDSVTDLPMLECVGHPVAVNADRDLARVAAERGWETRAFNRPVPIRRRTRRGAPLAGVSCVVAVAIAGCAAAWWRSRHEVRAWLRSSHGPPWRNPLEAAPGRPRHQAAPGRPRHQATRWWRGRSGDPGAGQPVLSLRAATTPRATRMARRMIFFMSRG